MSAAWGVGCPLPLTCDRFPQPCPPAQPRPVSTRADLDEAVVLNEDGVAGQVPVDDGGAAGVQKTAGVGGEQAEPGHRAPERSGAAGQAGREA